MQFSKTSRAERCSTPTDCERSRIHFGYEDGNCMSPDEELRWVRRREGTRRSGSKETAGYDRDLLRDNGTGNLLGPTESRPANIDEIIRSHTSALPSRPTARQVILEVIMEAAEPYIRRGVDAAFDAAVRGGSKLWERAVSKRAQGTGEKSHQSSSGSAQKVPVPATAETRDEAGTLEVRKLSVTSEQYQAMHFSALEAEQFAARVRQLLDNVEVRDGAIPVESGASAALEVTASSLDEATLRCAVAQLLDGGRTVDGEFILAKNQDTDDQLRTIDEQPVEAKSLSST